MSTETIAVLSILLLCWILFLAADAAFCLILHLIFRISFRKAFTYGLLSLIIPPAAMLYGALIERNIFKVSEVQIEAVNLPEAFDGYRIVHISDIHSRSFSKRRNALERVVAKINALDADLVAFTGDIITMESSELDGVSNILTEIEARDGVMSVLGNHDYCIYGDPRKSGAPQDSVRNVIDKVRLMGWDILLDENRRIYRGNDSIAVIGVENTSSSPHFPSKGNLSKASAGTEGLFRIVLTHDPMHWDMEIADKDYPLTLSGHTHALQFSLFGWCPSRYIFKQYRGLYSKGDRHLYVNIGLGETIFPARIGTPPEITLITLRASRNV